MALVRLGRGEVPLVGFDTNSISKGGQSRGELGEGLGAKPKDAAQVPANQEPLGQGTTKHLIPDSVGYEHPPLSLFEQVLVDPRTVGPAQLLVDEFKGWIPSGNQAAPAQWESVDGQPVVQGRPSLYFRRRAAQDPEAEPSGRERFQIIGVGKKIKHILELALNMLLALEQERPVSLSEKLNVAHGMVQKNTV